MLTLVGISKKGKQRVKERGDQWRIVSARDTVLFSDKRGLWFLIVPAGKPDDDASSRWIHSTNDNDFLVLP